MEGAGKHLASGRTNLGTSWRLAYGGISARETGTASGGGGFTSGTFQLRVGMAAVGAGAGCAGSSSAGPKFVRQRRPFATALPDGRASESGGSW